MDAPVTEDGVAAAEAEAGADAGVLKRRAQEAALEGLAVEAVVVAFTVGAGKPQRVQPAVAGDVLDGEDAARLALTSEAGSTNISQTSRRRSPFFTSRWKSMSDPEDFGDAAGDGRRDAGGIRGRKQGGVDLGPSA